MARWLKHSTATTLMLGPFLDRTDGYTEETDLSPSVELSKQGGAFAARNASGTITHDQNGWYRVPLDAADTNTVGPLLVKIDDAWTHLPVWCECLVLPAQVYDSLVGSDRLQVDVIECVGEAVAAGALPNAAAGSAGGLPIVDSSNAVKVQAGTGANQLDLAGGKVKLASTGLDGVTIESGMNARQALSVIAAAAAGVLTGAASTTVQVAAAGVPGTQRIVAVVDANGNRNSVTLHLPT